MPCGESLRVQAYFDGELDALNAAEGERHAEACPECRGSARQEGESVTAGHSFTRPPRHKHRRVMRKPSSFAIVSPVVPEPPFGRSPRNRSFRCRRDTIIAGLCLGFCSV